MNELLAALGPRAQRWPWLAAAAVVACTAGGLVFALRGDEPEPCGGGSEQIAAVWSPWRAVAAHAAMLATGVPYAESTWREVEHTLDRYAADWTAMHGAACRATRVRRDQPESVLELRMTCLDVRLHGLGGLVRTLGTADRTVVENAVSAAAGLPAIAECADLAALENPVKPPSPAAQREVARLAGTIAELEAQRRLGRYELTAAKALVAPVTSLGYRPLEAHLYALIAGIERDLEHFEAARDAYEHSVLAAEAGRDDRRMAGSLIELIAVVGHGLGNVKDVGPLRERARAVLERLGHPPEREAVLAEVLGDVEIEAGALDAAEHDLDHAIASWEQLYGRDDLHLVEALRSRGYLDLQRERIAEARPFLERTLAIQVRVLGDQHPQLGQTIQLIGDAEAGAGNYDAAAEHYRRAMTIEERSVGAESAGVATLLASLANVETWRGNTDAALELVQRAIAIDVKSMGADHPITLSHQSQLASTLEAASRYADSIAVLEALLPKYRAQLGPDHQMIAYTLGSLASVELDLNKFAAARDHAREAIAMKRRLMGDDYKSYAEGRTLGVALLGLGDAAQAADVLEAADRDLDRSLDPGVVARLDADLGRALFAAGRDLPRARKLVLGAWRHIASDDRMLVERAALARWMKAHGV